MKKIPLTQNKTAVINDRDYPMLILHKWHTMKRKNTWYAGSKIDGKSVYMHHFILGKKKGFVIDHIDRDGLNNQRVNLRFVTPQQNNMNQPKNCLENMLL